MGGSHQQPPPASVLFLVYTGLAFLIVFLFGKKDPSNQDFVQELAPVVVVTCGFLVSYELLDVMAVGAAKLKTKCYDPPRSSDEINQEEVYLAQRVQTNQVEQISPFLIGSYAVTYRASIGIPVSKAGLAKFTVPCYFILNAMLMSSVIQSARMMIVGM